MMIKNYLKTALRALSRQKGFTAINLLGLTIGMAASILIFLWVKDEVSYDKHFNRAEDIYRINVHFIMAGQETHGTWLPAQLGPTLLEEFPEVESFVRFRKYGSFTVQYQDISYTEKNLIYSDSTFFDFFSIPLTQGDREDVLTRPMTIAISEKIANKYFGDENPIGKMLKLDNGNDFEVTGVFSDLPANTHFQFNMIVSLSSSQESKDPIWLSNNFQTYIKLQPNADHKALEAKFPDLVRKKVGPQMEQYLNKSIDELMGNGLVFEFFLMPMLDIHLHSQLEGEFETNGSIKFVYIFITIALFILIIACINFINLTTAQYSKRAKEVGVRKSLGANRSQLVWQFFGESLLLAVLAMNFALILVQQILPAFNNFVNKEIEIQYFDAQFILSIAALVIFTGSVAGLYPSVFLSSFNPVKVLKGELKIGKGSTISRSALVIFQFFVSIVLIIGSVTIYNQIRYIQNKDVGYNKEQVLIIQNAYVLDKQLQTFKDELTKFPELKSVTLSGFLPTPSNRSSSAIYRNRNFSDEKTSSFQIWRIDYNYFETLGMELLEGRNFSPEYGSDSMAMIINEAAVRHYELGENPIGAELSTFVADNQESHFKIVGVVKDFHYESLREPIRPMVFLLGRSSSSVAVRLNTNNIKNTLVTIESLWNKYNSDIPFSYTFMDDSYNKQYRNELKLGNIVGIFSLLAIVVASLGLFGLATFTVEQRTKEIGIRKSMGSTSTAIVLLLNKKFLQWVGVSILLAIPLGYYAMNSWLQGFAYQINMSISLFIISGSIAVIIAVLTISTQVLRAANRNPVTSLRYE